MSLGFGIKKDPIELPRLSLLSLKSEIEAWAFDVWPTNLRPFSTYPKYVLSAFSAKESKSILRITDVDEYNSGIVGRSDAAEGNTVNSAPASGTIVSIKTEVPL